MFPHQAPYPLLGGREALVPRPRPHLAVALASKTQGLSLGQHLSNPGDQPLVRQDRLAAPGTGWNRPARARRA